MLAELTSLDIFALREEAEAQLALIEARSNPKPPAPAEVPAEAAGSYPASRSEEDASPAGSASGGGEEDIIKRFWGEVSRTAIMLLPSRLRARLGVARATAGE